MAERKGRRKGIQSKGQTEEVVINSGQRSATTPEERNELISKAAYFRAERRGFTPGSELEDWLQAEEEIERMLEKRVPTSGA